MLNIPDPPEFVPYITALFGAFGITAFAVIWFILRSRRQDKMYHEFRIVFMFFIVLLSLGCWGTDWAIYETAHGGDIRTAREIERVYGVEFDRYSADVLLDGLPAEASDGKTYRLEDDKLIVAEGWADVP